MTGLGVGVAHAMTVAPEVAQHLADARSAGKPLALIVQRSNHLLDPIVVVEQDVTQLVELGAPSRIVLAIAGIERGLQLLGGVVEVDHRGGLAGEGVEIAPVVVGPVGDGDHLQVGPSPEHGGEFGAEHRLQRRFLRLGHARDGQGIKPFPFAIVDRQRRATRLLVA